MNEVVKNKHWYLSKLNWVNAITLLVNILALTEVLTVLPKEALPYIDAVVAVLNMVLRTFYTDSNLTK